MLLPLDTKEESKVAPDCPPLAKMDRVGGDDGVMSGEDTPAYTALKHARVLCSEFRRGSVDDIFTGLDLSANTDRIKNIHKRVWSGYYCLPCLYCATHTELFVPAGHVGFLMDQKNRYLFARRPSFESPRPALIRTPQKRSKTVS